MKLSPLRSRVYLEYDKYKEEPLRNSYPET